VPSLATSSLVSALALGKLPKIAPKPQERIQGNASSL
jgi:hypothetical protein